MQLCFHSFGNIIIEKSVLFLGFLSFLRTSGLELEKKILASTGKPETTFNFDREGFFPDLRAARFS